jgi:hypothetical protein
MKIHLNKKGQECQRSPVREWGVGGSRGSKKRVNIVDVIYIFI